jgi:hypothetical protein
MEPEQEQLLADMVEAARKVPRHEQQWHLGGEYLASNELAGPWGTRPVLTADVDALREAGLLEDRHLNYLYGDDYIISAKGYKYYAAMKERDGQPLDRTENETRRLLASEGFQEAYPGAYERWADAEKLLWSATSERELSTIGHKVREATQLFATALIERYQSHLVEADPARTKNRLRAVIEQHRAALGARRAALLDALIVYWEATIDAIQRQEHGEQKCKQALTWLDGRRVVFHTASLMVEIAATLEEVDEPPPVAWLEGGGQGRARRA